MLARLGFVTSDGQRRYIDEHPQAQERHAAPTAPADRDEPGRARSGHRFSGEASDPAVPHQQQCDPVRFTSGQRGEVVGGVCTAARDFGALLPASGVRVPLTPVRSPCSIHPHPPSSARHWPSSSTTRAARRDWHRHLGQNRCACQGTHAGEAAALDRFWAVALGAKETDRALLELRADLRRKRVVESDLAAGVSSRPLTQEARSMIFWHDARMLPHVLGSSVDPYDTTCAADPYEE